MITLTDKAVAEVERIMADQGLSEDYRLRLSVTGGGCSGFSYLMQFHDDAHEGDVERSFGSLKVALASDAIAYLENIVLDFEDDVNKRGFVWNNPNASGTCGCGTSFSV